MNAATQPPRERRRRLLCIEADRESANILTEALGERGFDVLVVHDGREGLALILESEPDAVVCDVDPPGLSGFEILKRLTWAAPRLKEMPFIFLTALADRDTELAGRRLGADDYVSKPIDFDMLEMILNARLARVARGDIRSQGVRLSSREVDVLTWSARGKTSEEIAQILNLSKRTVDFHMDGARAKLQATTRIQAVVKAVSGGLIAP
jgi:DNA-binding response OmpR family regulator